VKTKLRLAISQEHSVTLTKRSVALSPFGPVRAGLTTLRTTQEVPLTELLNSLESKVEMLNYKSFAVYDTLNTAIEEIRALLSPTVTDEVGTK